MTRYSLFAIVIFALGFSQTAYAENSGITLNAPQSQEKQTKKPIWNTPERSRSSSEQSTQNAEETREQKTEEQPKPQSPSNANIRPQVMEYVGFVYESCASAWKTFSCVQSLSSLSRDITIDYAERLEKARQSKFQDSLKENCAATTAALQQEVPAYAQKSAMTVCFNAISDIAQASGVKPDLDLYQLAVGSVACIDQVGACKILEDQLSGLIQAK